MKSFTFRLTFRLAVLVTATAAAVLVAGGFLLDRQSLRGIEALHEVEAQELARLLGNDGNLPPSEVARRVKEDADSDSALFFIEVARRDGEVVFRSDNLGDSILVAPTHGERHWTELVPFLGRVRLTYYEGGPWRIHIGSALQPTERALRNYVRVSIALMVAVTLVSLGVGYIFGRETLRPLRAIAETAQRVRADNLGERIAVPAGRDELAQLAQLLNETFDRLQLSFEQARRFTADVSHELKTPLALIRLNAEKLRVRLAHDEDGQRALDDILEELSQLHLVIDKLLFIAKSESGALTLAVKTVALAPLMQAFSEDAQALAEDGGATFLLAGEMSGEIRAEPDLLRQLLLNLVTNAVSVSPPNGRVTLEFSRAGEAAEFVVCDEGPGLPEAYLTQIFERFFRFHHVPPSDETTRGHGLGLAICRAIAEAHGGTIRAENRRDRTGLRVVVRLPNQPV